MRGAYGKPQSLVARVRIGQVIMSIRCRDNAKADAYEAMRRAKFKFPGRQKVCLNTAILSLNRYLGVALFFFLFFLPTPFSSEHPMTTAILKGLNHSALKHKTHACFLQMRLRFVLFSGF